MHGRLIQVKRVFFKAFLKSPARRYLECMKTYYTEPKPGEEHEAASCPICGRQDTRPLWDCGSFRFARCSGCAHVYQNPRPVKAALAGRYDEGYKQYEIESAAPFFKLMRLGLADLGFDELEARMSTDRSFLDVGCATGVLVRHLADRGWKSVGVELCEGSARWGIEKRGVDIRIGTLEDAAFAEASFDFVHASHLIEHLSEPGRYVDELRRIMKPGGYVITVTPTTSGLQARLFGASWRSVIADHVQLFSTPGLKRLFLERGFSIERVKTWGGLAQGYGPTWLKRPLDYLAKRWGFGDVVALLARKAP